MLKVKIDNEFYDGKIEFTAEKGGTRIFGKNLEDESLVDALQRTYAMTTGTPIYTTEQLETYVYEVVVKDTLRSYFKSKLRRRGFSDKEIVLLCQSLRLASFREKKILANYLCITIDGNIMKITSCDRESFEVDLRNGETFGRICG